MLSLYVVCLQIASSNLFFIKVCLKIQARSKHIKTLCLLVQSNQSVFGKMQCWFPNWHQMTDYGQTSATQRSDISFNARRTRRTLWAARLIFLFYHTWSLLLSAFQRRTSATCKCRILDINVISYFQLAILPKVGLRSPTRQKTRAWGQEILLRFDKT